MKKRTIISLLIIVLILIFIAGAVISKKKVRHMEVEAFEVKTANLKREVSDNGVIESKEHATVISEVAGAIKSIPAEEGEKISKGSIIALIDNRKILVQRQAALSALAAARKSVKEELLNLRAAYNQAKINYEQSLRELNSTEELYKIQSASNDQLSSVKDKFRLAKGALLSARQRLNLREGRKLNDPRETAAKDDSEIIENSVEVEHAKANLDGIDNDLNNCRIKSPIKGIITRIAVEKGSVVAPGTVIAEVQDKKQLEVVVNIDEVDIGYVKTGQKVRIESDTFIDSTLNGRVSYIAPVIVQKGDSRTCQVKIDIDDPENLAKIGASCSIYITVERKDNVPAIGIDEYLLDKDKKYAFKLIKTGKESKLYKVKKTEIKTGIIGIEKIEVVSGLKKGDKIAAGNLKSLSDGQIVAVKE
ncbi:MAG: efflux RND transporter periplasmic adaptor subunit [Spirochaetales bacterium]|nr:efflux RND transporter periplasmic adaptor subunit [Spirochaetales bacterium]